MNILFTVCGRAGSKGLKNKNLSLFLGHPLLYYPLSLIDLFIKKLLKLIKKDTHNNHIYLQQQYLQYHQYHQNHYY